MEAKFDPKTQKMNPELKEKVKALFGMANTEIDVSDIDFKVKVGSIIEANEAMETMLGDLVKLEE